MSSHLNMEIVPSGLSKPWRAQHNGLYWCLLNDGITYIFKNSGAPIAQQNHRLTTTTKNPFESSKMPRMLWSKALLFFFSYPMPFLLIKKFKDSYNLKCVLTKYFMLLEIYIFLNFLLIFSFEYKILASLLSDTYGASLVPQTVRICLQCRRLRFDTWIRMILWRRKWLPTPVFLPRQFYGQRSLARYSQWGRNESGRTNRLTL